MDAVTISPATPVALSTITPWQTVVDAYLNTLTSPATRRAYRRHIYDCLAYTGVNTLADLRGQHLAGWYAMVMSATARPHAKNGEPRSLSAASRGQAVAAVRAFLRWARAWGAHGLPDETLRALLPTPKGDSQKKYNILHEPEIAAVLRAADNPRDKALAAVLLGAGLRAAEVVNLDVDDLYEDSDGGAVFHVRHGKGRKTRDVPVQPEVARLVRRYLAATGRKMGETGPLFRAHDRAAGKLARGRLSTRAVGFLVGRLTTAAGVDAKTISPHSMRHSFAVRSLRGGGSVMSVSKLLGHSSVAVTSRYLDHLNLPELRAAIPALPVDG